MPAPRTDRRVEYPYYTMVCMCTHDSPGCSPSAICDDLKVFTALVCDEGERDALRAYACERAPANARLKLGTSSTFYETDDGAVGQGEEPTTRNDVLVEYESDDEFYYGDDEYEYTDDDDVDDDDNESECTRIERHESPSHDDNLIFMFEPPTQDIKTEQSLLVACS